MAWITFWYFVDLVSSWYAKNWSQSQLLLVDNIKDYFPALQVVFISTRSRSPQLYVTMFTSFKLLCGILEKFSNLVCASKYGLVCMCLCVHLCHHEKWIKIPVCLMCPPLPPSNRLTFLLPFRRLPNSPADTGAPALHFTDTALSPPVVLALSLSLSVSLQANSLLAYCINYQMPR